MKFNNTERPASSEKTTGSIEIRDQFCKDYIDQFMNKQRTKIPIALNATDRLAVMKNCDEFEQRYSYMITSLDKCMNIVLKVKINTCEK